MITAAVLAAAALAGWAVFLSGRSLEDADRWASVVGFFVNALLTAGSLVLARRSLRGPAAAAVDRPGAGAVRVGGHSRGPISTAVVGGSPAAGAGSVSVAGDSTAAITTRITTQPVAVP